MTTDMDEIMVVFECCAVQVQRATPITRHIHRHHHQGIPRVRGVASISSGARTAHVSANLKNATEFMTATMLLTNTIAVTSNAIFRRFAISISISISILLGELFRFI